jgi:hypothetical protein
MAKMNISSIDKYRESTLSSFSQNKVIIKLSLVEQQLWILIELEVLYQSVYFYHFLILYTECGVQIPNT